MNKTKLSILLLITAVILLFSSCGNIMVESDDISIDLSSVVSKATIDGVNINYIKVWLVAEGTSNFYDLGDQATKDITNDPTITLTKIPVGPTYKIYMSLGNVNSEGDFTISRTINGLINVTGGTTTTKTLTAKEIKTSLFPSLVGFPVKGAAFTNGKISTISEDGSILYHGTLVDGLNEKAAPTGVILKDVDEGSFEGIDVAIVTAKATNAQAVGTFNSSDVLSFDMSAGLPTTMYDTYTNQTVDLLSSFIYYDAPNELQLGISQMNGGIVLSVHGDLDGNGYTTEWLPVDFSEALSALEDLDISLDGDFFKGFAVLNKGTEIWFYAASKIGNFKISVPISESGFDDSGFGDDTNPLSMFTDFVINNDTLKDRVVLNLANADNTYLFVGTDSGLYKMTATANVGDMKAKEIYAVGERIEMVACSTDYTAAVTALELIIINSDGEVAKIAFNEGLPVNGLLNDGGITGLDWADNILYVAGNYGLVSVNAAELF